MPIYNDLGRPHAANKPHYHKSRDARWVLPHGQLKLYARVDDPNLCDNKLRCVGDYKQEGDEDSEDLVCYLHGGDNHKR